MPRIHCYAPKGQRCFGTHDWQARARVNAIGALLAGALLTVGLTTANVDAQRFSLWLEHDLIPKLPPGAVLVMDNATFHERQDTKVMIENAEHVLEYTSDQSRPRVDGNVFRQ